MPESSLSVEERRQLLSVARGAIARHLEGRPSELPAVPEGGLTRPAGAFVTLRKGSQLRGCIGTFAAHRPLVETVHEMAIAAAFSDPRFEPLRAEELDDIELEISALSPRRAVDQPEDIVVGRHGLCVSKGSRGGVLLPQVATDYGWGREDFLKQTCLKAGLPSDAWRWDDTVIEVFEAEVFGEDELDAEPVEEASR